ncbi:Hypothetical protein SMAX5B_011689 [Scophthalmus maximus]|uniref:Uncharacterized protein n=1 Tax=Scophthalmus maximus TaxID=52904 RepID=A0A2U9AX52_SCOMX|nr:Hypothetical protein SMAX5B_011689 [Scophthalmus maximus]
MSIVTASNTGCREETPAGRTEDGASMVAQLEEVTGRLATLSEKITTCGRVLGDLKGLSDVLMLHIHNIAAGKRDRSKFRLCELMLDASA